MPTVQFHALSERLRYSNVSVECSLFISLKYLPRTMHFDYLVHKLWFISTKNMYQKLSFFHLLYCPQQTQIGCIFTVWKALFHSKQANPTKQLLKTTFPSFHSKNTRWSESWAKDPQFHEKYTVEVKFVLRISKLSSLQLFKVKNLTQILSVQSRAKK